MFNVLQAVRRGLRSLSEVWPGSAGSSAPRKVAAVVFSSTCLWLALPAQAMDDPPGRVGRVADVSGGQAWMQENGQGEWFEMVRNRPVTAGDRISTDRDARLLVQIGSTSLRLGGSSEASFERLDDDRVEVLLDSGTAALRIREPEAIHEFGLATQEGRFTPRSTGSFRVDRSEYELQASALLGELQFTGSGSNVVLRGGQRVRLGGDSGRPSELVWLAASDDEFDRWLRSEESRQAPRMAQGPVSSEMTGAEDLVRNGQWETHPEYGQVWTPTTVAVDWAPYRYGRWVSVQPWGWTWVDDAPWGFAPFHYGRWVFWSNRWRWAPGEYVRRPVYAPAMVAWVGGKNWGVSISGGAPTVGWVPLAPREVYVPTFRHTTVYVQRLNITHVHLPPTYRSSDKPARPIIYANQGRPGGLGMLEAKAFEKHQPRGLAVRPAAGVLNQGAALLKLERAAPPQAPSRPAVPVSENPGRRFPNADRGSATGEADEGRFKPRDGRASRVNEPVMPTPAAEPRARPEHNGAGFRDNGEGREGRDKRDADMARPQAAPAVIDAPRPQRAEPPVNVERQERIERRAARNDAVERPERADRIQRREAREAQAPKAEAPKGVDADKPLQPKPRPDADRKPGKHDPRRDGMVN